ncbi:MAG: 2-succinyl-6-hydroxy-2,4-cyclohexadiene-1-carboxylate synthase [Deltaproteobacteria bacterium]|nr:2-succinyl-6-hydroxy-2,4-cyclohexadiene-1-carboxylate synthase [Deltaproteobacteria bacterium]
MPKLASSLHYETYGNPSAQPIVFFHGFMGNTKDWGDVISHLSNTYYCIAIDLPGHGKSLGLAEEDMYTFSGALDATVHIMEHEQAIPATVVGYSMGGRFALYMAVHFSYTCSRLIIESASPGIREGYQREKRRQLDDRRADELKRSNFEDFLRSWYHQPIFETVAESEERLEQIISKRRFNDTKELAKALRGMGVGRQDSLWEYLPALYIPALLVTGERDDKYMDVLLNMAASMPNATLKTVPGRGHNVHMEDPVAMTQWIEGFLEKE